MSERSPDYIAGLKRAAEIARAEEALCRKELDLSVLNRDERAWGMCAATAAAIVQDIEREAQDT